MGRAGRQAVSTLHDRADRHLPHGNRLTLMKRRVCVAAVVMGFSGLVAEILLLRELLIVFSGNELSIGIILANWLILEALGCFFPGRMVEQSRSKLEGLVVISVLFSLSLVAAVFLTRNVRNVMGVSVGESLGLLPVFYASFLILLPVSLLHGALFTFSCHLYSIFSADDASSAGRIYVYETVGTIAGGIASTYLLIPYLNAFQAAIGIALLNFTVCAVLLASYRKTGGMQKAILGMLCGLVALSVYSLSSQADQLHSRSVQAQWKNLNVVHYQDSPYGNIAVIENDGQYIYFLDGVPTVLIPVPDIPFLEEFVHLPLLAHPDPREILILSGGAGGMINEVLKHPSIETVEYAELDPLLVSLFRKFPTPLTESELNDERVKTRHVDGRLFLRTTPNTYDLIFVGIMEPFSLQTNRFFTREFFSLAEDRLNEGGILVFGAPGSLMFLNEELKDLNSSILSTVSSVFSDVRVIPGDGRNIFLVSDSPEVSRIDRAQIVRELSERNIATSVVVPWHIERKLHHGWQDWFTGLLEGSSQEINYDFKPVGLFYSISHWNALFAPSFGRLFRQLERVTLRAIVLLLVFFLLFYFLLRTGRAKLRHHAIPLCIVTTGFAGMVFSLVFIFAFQSVYGYVFSWIGLLVASFMAGAAAGARLTTTILPRMERDLRLFIGVELAIIGYSAALPPLLLAVNAYAGSTSALQLLRILFLALSFIGGLLIGSQFPLANQLYLEDSASLSGTAGLLYASDLVGGWLGGIIGAVALLPVLGLTGTCVTVGLINLASLIVVAAETRLLSVRR